MSMLLENKIKEHFRQSSYYKSRRGYIHPEFDPLILRFIKETKALNSKILEVGGGSGYMLNLIATETGIKDLFNCEIVPEVYKIQRGMINLVGGDALNLPFKTSSFNYVIIKNLLHHLVGKTRRQSKENARKAIKEFLRILRNKGYIVILEQYNKYVIFSFLIFYITLLLSRKSLSFEPLGLHRNVVVSFLNPSEIKEMLVNMSKIRVDIVVSKMNRLNVPWTYRLTLLMTNIGRVLFIGKVSKVYKVANVLNLP